MMHKITELVLRRPVTTLLAVISLVFFGFMSVANQKMELMAEIDMPMMIVTTTYSGASPEDVDKLITKPIENGIAVLSDVKKITSRSMENFGMTIIQYEYGTDMDKAYDSLKKKMDSIRSTLPEDAKDPTYLEMNMNEQPTLYLSVLNSHQDNMYNYVTTDITPELEKLTSVASLNVSGGRAEYVRVQLIPEKMRQYKVDMSTIANIVKSADFSIPAGTTKVGKQDLTVSTGNTYDTVESLCRIPITTGTGNTIYLQDIAVVQRALKKQDSIGRYNGSDTVMVSLTKKQRYSAVDLSSEVLMEMEELKKTEDGLEYDVIYDGADDIRNSLQNVFETMILAVIVSMIIILVFFGDWKASLIVGTSIPLSILVALVAMNVMGYSINLITMSSLVLGVGMMVDNSIVVLEACFRAMDYQKTKTRGALEEAAVDAVKTVGGSVFGSTLTTCVVFLPLGFIKGLSGQFFAPLGFTIVFCMVASLISAISIVPMCFVIYKPEENTNAPVYKYIRSAQDTYRSVVDRLLNHKAFVLIISIVMLVGSLFLATQIKVEMMPATDNGQVTITVKTKPNLRMEELSRILEEIETVIADEPDLKKYTVQGGGSGMSLVMSGSDSSITAYLKSDRKLSTKETVKKWREKLKGWPDAVITVEAANNMSTMSVDKNHYETILSSTNYERLKSVSDQIVEELQTRDEVTAVHSTLENAAPMLKITVDPVKAAAEGLSPAAIGGQIYNTLSGTKVRTMKVEDQDLDVYVEYEEDEYDEIGEIKGILLSKAGGSSVKLGDICDVGYVDSPQTIRREDRKYSVTITADYTAAAGHGTSSLLEKEVISKYRVNGVERLVSSEKQRMNEEFTSLGNAIATAVFLIWVVMAAQFESMRFSFMVMTTIPFALIGSFSLLWIADGTLSMTSLLGFLMLIGTVVNNGILYVDTVNQYRDQMSVRRALVEAGATRLRPILMTTLTTVIAMIPMAVGYGKNGATMQGLALVDLGGLTASTVLSLLMLPIYYAVMDKKKKNSIPDAGYMQGNDPKEYLKQKLDEEADRIENEDSIISEEKNDGLEEHDLTDGFPD